MLCLFNQVFMTTIDRLEDGTNRYIVSPDIADHFVDDVTDEIADTFKIKQLKRTWGFCKTPDDFFSQRLMEWLKVLYSTERRVVIYLDNTSYTALFIVWHRMLYPTLDDAAHHTLLDMFLNFRRVVEGPVTVDMSHVTYLVEKADVSELRSSLPWGLDLPIEYRLVDGYLYSEGVADTANRLRAKLTVITNNLIRANYQRVIFLWWQPELQQRIQSLNASHVDDVLEASLVTVEQLQDPVFRNAFEEKFKRDTLIAQACRLPTINLSETVNELITPLRLQAVADDMEIINVFWKKIREVDRISLLLPPQELTSFTANFLTWISNNHEVPRLNL